MKVNTSTTLELSKKSALAGLAFSKHAPPVPQKAFRANPAGTAPLGVDPPQRGFKQTGSKGEEDGG